MLNFMSWQQAYISMLFDAHATRDSDLDEFAVDQTVSTHARLSSRSGSRSCVSFNPRAHATRDSFDTAGTAA